MDFVDRETVELGPVVGLPHLEELTINDYDHAALKLCRLVSNRLKSLAIFNDGRVDLWFLPSLPRLENLKIIDRFSNLMTLAGINSTRALTHLSLVSCGRLGTLRDLNGLPYLTSISFSEIPHVDLTGFVPRGRVLEIVLSKCGEVDLMPLSGAPNVVIYHGGGTLLRHAEELGEGSKAIRTSGGPKSRWPFS